MKNPIRLILLLGGLFVPGGAAGQDAAPLRLDLDAAVARAEAGATVTAARLRIDGARLQADAVDGTRLPTVGARIEGVTTDDPVAAFGTRLRQGRFTQADFALDALNDPSRIGDLSAGVEVSWTVWSRSRAAQADAAAAGVLARSAAGMRTIEGVRYATRMLYLGALEAAEHRAAAEAGLEAAGATLDVVSRRAEQGVATEADRLLAVAAAQGMRAEVARARAREASAHARLAAHLGEDGRGTLVLTSDLSSVVAALDRAVAAGDGSSVDGRADLRAARAMAAATEAEGAGIGGIALPVVEAFSAAALHRGDGSTGNSWTAGVRVSVPLLTGWTAGRRAESLHMEARALELEADQRAREAKAELIAAEAELDASDAAALAARAALDAAIEAERLTRLRYEEGMATLSDLLSAQSAATTARTALARAEAMRGRARATWIFTAGDGDSTERTTAPDGAEMDR